VLSLLALLASILWIFYDQAQKRREQYAQEAHFEQMWSERERLLRGSNRVTVPQGQSQTRSMIDRYAWKAAEVTGKLAMTYVAGAAAGVALDMIGVPSWLRNIVGLGSSSSLTKRSSDSSSSGGLNVQVNNVLDPSWADRVPKFEHIAPGAYQ